MNEKIYLDSLEEFVKSMDNHTLESIVKFLNNLKQPPTKYSLSTLSSVIPTLPWNNQLEELLNNNSIEEFLSLLEKKLDFSFNNMTNNHPISSFQEKLDLNNQLLYKLQILQYERTTSTPSENEQKIGNLSLIIYLKIIFSFISFI